MSDLLYNNKSKQLLVMDLDGTLYRNGQIHPVDLDLLQKADNSLIRVIATGRNLFSVSKVLNAEFPIDYLIASSGVAIIDWKTKNVLKSYYLQKEDIQSIIALCKMQQTDFMLHKTGFESHNFYYKKLNNQANPDFDRRIKLYKDFAINFGDSMTFDESYSMLVIIAPRESPKLVEYFRKQLPNNIVIRSTSPLDHKSMWIEVYPKAASKAHGAELIVEWEQIGRKNTISVGNDYNDLDLLNWTHHSYIINEGKHIDYSRYKIIDIAFNKSILGQIFSC